MQFCADKFLKTKTLPKKALQKYIVCDGFSNLAAFILVVLCK